MSFRISDETKPTKPQQRVINRDIQPFKNLSLNPNSLLTQQQLKELQQHVVQPTIPHVPQQGMRISQTGNCGDNF